jgi:hypothetical protein
VPKNYRQVPQAILNRLQTFADDAVVVATAKRLRAEDIARYAHLGLRLEDGTVKVPPPTLPNVSAGYYSRANVEGKDVKRKDLPKISKEFCFYAPSWNSSDTHLVCHTRDVYQIDFIRPKGVSLSITLLGEESGTFLIKFGIEQVIDRNQTNFHDELLYNLNLLQENVGSIDVFASDSTIADFAATIRVEWELLPIGHLPPSEILSRILHGKSAITPDERATMEQRLRVFSKLKPTHIVSGSSGFSRYVGAKFADNFVAFENIRYGNALYVMFDDWLLLSQKSRLDLLNGPREGFERIEHRDGWEDRLEALLERFRD